MSLTFNTSVIKWASPEGQNIVKIVNDSKVRFAFKIKTTNVDVYSTSPNVDFIEPGFTFNVVVIRKKSAMKEDKLAVSYLECKPEDKDAAEVFKKPGARPNVFVLTMKCDGGPSAETVGAPPVTAPQ